MTDVPARQNELSNSSCNASPVLPVDLARGREIGFRIETKYHSPTSGPPPKLPIKLLPSKMFAGLLKLACLAALASQVTLAKDATCDQYVGIDFAGNDIGNKPGKSAADCCKICSDFPRCKVYSWNNYNNGTCWLKSEAGQVEFKTGVTSSSLAPITNDVCGAVRGIDFVGNDLTNKPAPESGACCSICKATNGCKAYTWTDYNGGTCWLKSSYGSVAAYGGAVSAIVSTFDPNAVPQHPQVPPGTTLAPSPPATAPPLPSACTILKDKDRLGFDLTSWSSSLQWCPSKCQRTPECLTWSWNDYNGGTCWLKTYPGKLVDKPGVTSTNCVYDRPHEVCNANVGIDFAGNDIANKPGKSAADCCSVCNEYGGCKAYSWTNYNNGTCWLKSSVGQVEYNAGVTSSVLSPLHGDVCGATHDVDFVGNDIASKGASSASTCCGFCKATAGCKAYTWTDYNGGTCWLKNGYGVTAKKAGAVSAILAKFDPKAIAQ